MQQPHVGEIRGTRLIPGRVIDHLDIRAQTCDVPGADSPGAAEAIGREDPIPAVLHPVHAVAVRIEPDKMHVDLAAAAVTEHEVRVEGAPR